MPGVPVPMKILLAPIELLGTIIKPFSLMIRLYEYNRWSRSINEYTRINIYI